MIVTKNSKDMKLRANKILIAFLVSATTLSLVLPSVSSAQTFDPNNVISDAVIRNYQTMNLIDIHLFLNRKGGLGNKFDIDPIDGLLKGAAQLIYDASIRHEVNPQYLFRTDSRASDMTIDPTPCKIA